MSAFVCTTVDCRDAVVAIAPGTEPEIGDLLSVMRDRKLTYGEPIVCRCMACLLAAFGGAAKERERT
jgi:hypothetical protein